MKSLEQIFKQENDRSFGGFFLGFENLDWSR